MPITWDCYCEWLHATDMQQSRSKHLPSPMIGLFCYLTETTWCTSEKTSSSHDGLPAFRGYTVFGLLTQTHAKGLPSRKCPTPLTGKPNLTVLLRHLSYPHPLVISQNKRNHKGACDDWKEDSASSRVSSVHASLAAACLGWWCCQQEGVTRRGGAAELFTFHFPSFSAARTGYKSIPISTFRIHVHQFF